MTGRSSRVRDGLRSRREQRGWSRPELAAQLQRQEHALNTGEELRLDPKLVEKWERGDVTPRPFYRARLCLLFDAAPEDLNLEPTARLDLEMRELLKGGRAGAPSAGSPSRPLGRIPSIDEPELQHAEIVRRSLTGALTEGGMTETSLGEWERAALSHGRASRDRPPIVLLEHLMADLAELHQMLRRCRTASGIRRLTRVAAQMSGLACLTLIKLDQRLAFRSWARTARVAASEAGDPLTYSWVVAQEAYGHFYSGDFALAAEAAQHAQESDTGTPSVGTALAAALEARAHAALQRPYQTRESLARAEAALASLDADSTIPSAFGYNEAQLRFHQSNAYTHLRDTKSAWRAQEQALLLCPPDDYMDRAFTMLDRADCLAHDGDTARAIEYATRTLSALTRQQRDGIIAKRATSIIKAIPTHEQSSPAVRDLDELLLPPNKRSRNVKKRDR